MAVVRLGEHQGHVNGFAAIVQIDGIEQRFDIVRVQPNASVGPVAVHADGMIGAVNADDGEAQADPVFAERVVGTGLDLVDNVLALLFLFALNRCGRPPGRVLFHLDHGERAGRRLPLLAGLPYRNRIHAAHAAILEMKEHPLRQVDLDQIGSFERNDVTIVDMNCVARMEPVCLPAFRFLEPAPGELSPSRDPIFVKESPSAAMRSNSAPTIRCASGGIGTTDSASVIVAEEGIAAGEGAGVAEGLSSAL